MRRWMYGDNGCAVLEYDVPTTDVSYDDIVDRSNFRPDSESVRQFVSNGVGSSGTGVYDDPDNPPSDLEVRLRSGKLDKAEVSQLALQEVDKLNKLADEKSKKAEQEKIDNLAKARQDYLDQKTGFSGSLQDNSNN